MGIFSIKKKEDKVYSLKDAIKLLQTSKYQNYTTIPVGEGYRLVPMKQPTQSGQEHEEISFTKVRRHNFLNRMTENVNNQEFTKVPNYNNYQEAKGYRQSQGISR